MNAKFEKGKNIGFKLSRNNPEILEELLMVLPKSSKFKQGLIEGFKSFNSYFNEAMKSETNYICKCGNCDKMEGFEARDEFGDLGWEDRLEFECMRCGEGGLVKMLYTKKKHKDAPDRPIPKKVYQRKKILEKIQLEEKDREEGRER